MVSIIDRNSYLSELRNNSKFELFFSLIFSLSLKDDFKTTAEIDEIFKNVIYSIVEEDENKFADWYEKISARKPSKYSPFTNDDLLIFVLVVGTLKFKRSTDWIKEVLDVRENTNEESRLITKTFLNIIQDNFLSKDNAFQIIIVIEELINKVYINWAEKKEFYSQIVRLRIPFFKSELLNITSFKAFDLIILEWDKSNENYFRFLKEFERGFIKRINIFSRIIYWVLCLVVIGAIAWLVFNPNYEGLMGKFDTLFGIIGVAIFSYLKSKNVISWIARKIQKILGYRQINNENE
jgi:hypothetical protein